MNSPELERDSDLRLNNTLEESLFANPCTSINSSASDATLTLEAHHLRQELKFFFKNPIQKWNAKRRIPFKFIFQIIKIFLVTFQLCIFAESRYNHMNYSINNKVAFSHLFLNVWDSSREVTNYPPVAGPLAVYQRTEFYESVDFAVLRYGNLSDSIGPYFHLRERNRTSPLKLCVYQNVVNSPESLVLNEKCDCWEILPENISNFSLEDFFHAENYTIQFDLLQKVTLNFPVIARVITSAEARCARFNIQVLYDNRNFDGLLLISLSSNSNKLRCDGLKFTKEAEFWSNVLNSSVILVCFCSLILCLRSIIRAQLLKHKTIRFFRRVKGVELSVEGRLEFWNFWFIMIIANDILIIIGSYVEGRISRNEYTTEEWSICSLCLGTGNMLVWFGVLRYFGFFKTYNVVILTLKRAFPKMARFLLCTLIIYAGFVFCGWLVLGPFHIKFRSISRTSENLFSLVNGDDMFATFTILESPSQILWWYSRIYLYSFISLFIYVILNLFLSVILDAYETIKEYYLHGFPKSDLQLFINESNNDTRFDDRIQNDNSDDHGVWSYLGKNFDWLRFH